MKNEIENCVGNTGHITMGKLKIKVKIKAVKNVYGRTRFLVTPMEGTGETWTEKVETK